MNERLSFGLPQLIELQLVDLQTTSTYFGMTTNNFRLWVSVCDNHQQQNGSKSNI